MIDHFTLKVRDYAKAKQFYLKVFQPLGYELAMEFGRMGGFGVPGAPDLWIREDPKETRPMHFALTAKDRGAVDAFYRAAMEAGAQDNGKPGIRKDYHPNYYAAFVLDPDGHNVEVVCHQG